MPKCFMKVSKVQKICMSGLEMPKRLMDSYSFFISLIHNLKQNSPNGFSAEILKLEHQ